MAMVAASQISTPNGGQPPPQAMAAMMQTIMVMGQRRLAEKRTSTFSRRSS